MEIDTLVQDIYNLFKGDKEWFTNGLAEALARDVSKRLTLSFEMDKRGGSLRLSKMGATCPRALWYSVNKPEVAEPLPPWVHIKLMYGHFLEALAITLAKAAGHRVEGEQDELILAGVKGHRDCIIDGCTVDVKSLSTIGFAKFKSRQIQTDDSFGYLDQLDGYVTASADDPLVTCKDKGYILGIDKTLGKLILYEHNVRRESIRSRISSHKSIVELASPPECNCGTIPDGKSGNIRLDTRASYSVFKHCCFPSLRTFLYSDGLVYLTKVVRKPDVPELKRDGSIIPRFS